jgi:hypothetical protein
LVEYWESQPGPFSLEKCLEQLIGQTEGGHHMSTLRTVLFHRDPRISWESQCDRLDDIDRVVKGLPRRKRLLV